MILGLIQNKLEQLINMVPNRFPGSHSNYNLLRFRIFLTDYNNSRSDKKPGSLSSISQSFNKNISSRLTRKTFGRKQEPVKQNREGQDHQVEEKVIWKDLWKAPRKGLF